MNGSGSSLLGPRLLALGLFAAVGPVWAAFEDGVPLPPAAPADAQAGECWALVHVPPSYRPVERQVLKTAASTRTESIPPVYETRTEKVWGKAYTRTVTVTPAVTETREVQTLVREAGPQEVKIAARYRWVDERVPVGGGTVVQPNAGGTDAMCLVEAPAEFLVQRRRKLVEPARTEMREMPAQYKTVREKLVVSEAVTKTVEVPAGWRTRRIKEMVEPARGIRVEVPAEYRTERHEVLAQPGRVEVRAVLCETNATPALVVELQRNLKRAGFDPGPVDGVFGPGTAEALQAFQLRRGYAVGGVTQETAEALGVKLDRVASR